MTFALLPDYYLPAIAYKQAADDLLPRWEGPFGRDSVPRVLPILFCYAHSVELMFKAFLVMKGYEVPIREHDLEVLCGYCVTEGFSLADGDESSIKRTIQLLNAAHNNYQNRYQETTLYSIGPRDATNDVEKLLKRVKKETKAYLDAQVAANMANPPTGTIDLGGTVLVGRAKPPSGDPNA